MLVMSAHFGELAESLRRVTVQVFSRGSGSGIIWRADGLILTNAHVAQGTEARVNLWDGRQFAARVVARDPRRDLATLQIEAAGLVAAQAGGSVRPGEMVLAVGNPLGFVGALSTGKVHAVGPDWIQARVQLAPGNSGGPLANTRGEVVGVNTAVARGMGLAAPIGLVEEFLARGPRPSLGVTLRPVEGGWEIAEMEAEGPAARASLRVGDVLLGSLEELRRRLDTRPEAIRIEFRRGGAGPERAVSVVV
jgi:serine protease Do